VAKPDGLLVVPPDRELAFLHRLPVERLWGVGRSRPANCAGGEPRPSTSVAALEDETLVLMLGRAVAGTCTRLAHNATRGRFCRVAAGSRWVLSAPSAAGGAP
jgi:DNA polymerase-4